MVNPPKTYLLNPENKTCTLKSSICMQIAPRSCRHETHKNNENTEHTHTQKQ